MLRNRSRAVTSNTKQALMADHSSQQSPSQTRAKPVSSFLTSLKFKVFLRQNQPATIAESLLSPNSILDFRAFSSFANPFSCDLKSPPGNPNSPRKTYSETKQSREKSDSGACLGLKLIDTLNDDDNETTESSSSKHCNKNVLFGTKLRVQIPPFPCPAIYPVDFGIKTQNSQESQNGSASSGIQTEGEISQLLGKKLSVSEMELSEDYTCVITHGPNPRTTHIFDNCIVESYCSLSDKSNPKPETVRYFLGFCYTCRKSLDQTKDIYIYRGEKAFCSTECRFQEMLVDRLPNSEFDHK